MKLLVGADPELFMKKGGEYVSAHGKIPGDKKNPYKVDKGAVQVDGMALEFNIDPAGTEEEFILNINTVMLALAEMVPEYELDPVAVVNFSKEVMDAQPQEAKVLGCEPDFNVWTGGVNPEPDANVMFRTAAGHVHLGWTDGVDVNDPSHIQACIDMGKQLDYMLYAPSLLLNLNDEKRRDLYGKPGSIRIKPYGMEYRVLSNFWLKSEATMSWVYQQCQSAFSMLLVGNYLDENVVALDVIEEYCKGTEGERRTIAGHMRHYDINMPPGVRNV